MIKKFRIRLQKEGRSFRWFHRTYIKGVSYPYFIVQLNDEYMMKEIVKKAIEKYLKD